MSLSSKQGYLDISVISKVCDEICKMHMSTTYVAKIIDFSPTELSGENEILLPENLVDALTIKEGSLPYVKYDTHNNKVQHFQLEEFSDLTANKISVSNTILEQSQLEFVSVPGSIKIPEDTSNALIIKSNINFIDISTDSNEIRLLENVVCDKNFTVNGDMITIDVTTLNIEDSVIKTCKNNALDTTDSGLYMQYSPDSGTTILLSGLVRDATDGRWKLFEAQDDADPPELNPTYTSLSNLDLNNLTTDSINAQQLVTNHLQMNGNLSGTINISSPITTDDITVNGTLNVSDLSIINDISATSISCNDVDALSVVSTDHLILDTPSNRYVRLGTNSAGLQINNLELSNNSISCSNDLTIIADNLITDSLRLDNPDDALIVSGNIIINKKVTADEIEINNISINDSSITSTGNLQLNATKVISDHSEMASLTVTNQTANYLLFVNDNKQLTSDSKLKWENNELVVSGDLVINSSDSSFTVNDPVFTLETTQAKVKINNQKIQLEVNSNDFVTVESDGSVILGQQTQISGSSNQGFVYLRTIDGIPTGSPQHNQSGSRAFVYAPSASSLFAFDGSWNRFYAGNQSVKTSDNVTFNQITVGDMTFNNNNLSVTGNLNIMADHLITNEITVADQTINNSLVVFNTITSGNLLFNDTIYLTGSDLIINTDTGYSVKMGNDVDSLQINNLKLQNNHISSLDANGNIHINPNGKGTVEVSKRMNTVGVIHSDLLTLSRIIYQETFTDASKTTDLSNCDLGTWTLENHNNVFLNIGGPTSNYVQLNNTSFTSPSLFDLKNYDETKIFIVVIGQYTNGIVKLEINDNVIFESLSTSGSDPRGWHKITGDLTPYLSDNNYIKLSVTSGQFKIDSIYIYESDVPSQIGKVYFGDQIGVNTRSPTKTLDVVGNMNLNSGTNLSISDYETNGNRNMLIGCRNNNVDGDDNVYLGYQTGNQNGSGNVYLGSESGKNATGNNNLLVGYRTGQNSSGDNNVILNYGQGIQGDENIFINSGESASSSTGNTVIGFSSGSTINDAQYNVVVGHSSGQSLIDGQNNIIFGKNSGNNIIGGSRNIILGHNAGNNHSDVNDRLIISNSDTAQPLIEGYFNGPYVIFNAGLSYRYKVETITSNTTLDNNHSLVRVLEPVIIILPLTSTYPGKKYIIANESDGTITINISGSNTIDGSSTSLFLTTKFMKVAIVSNGDTGSSGIWYTV